MEYFFIIQNNKLSEKKFFSTKTVELSIKKKTKEISIKLLMKIYYLNAFFKKMEKILIYLELISKVT